MTLEKRDKLLFISAFTIWVCFYTLVLYLFTYNIHINLVTLLALLAIPFYYKKISHEIKIHSKLPNFKKSWKLTLLSDMIYTNPIMLLVLIIFLWIMKHV